MTETTSKPIRVLLGEAASHHLDATSEDAFVVIAKDKSDDRSGRWVIHLLPCSIAQADAAVRVARGYSHERKPRTTSRP